MQRPLVLGGLPSPLLLLFLVIMTARCVAADTSFPLCFFECVDAGGALPLLRIACRTSSIPSIRNLMALQCTNICNAMLERGMASYKGGGGHLAVGKRQIVQETAWTLRVYWTPCSHMTRGLGGIVRKSTDSSCVDGFFYDACARSPGSCVIWS